MGKTEIQKLQAQSITRNGLQYCINQEQFLRFFERRQHPNRQQPCGAGDQAVHFRHKNWVCVNSIHGTEASAILYSIVETARANGLKVYDYPEFLLTELPKHANDADRDFLEDLLPWPKTVQEKCSNRKIYEIASKLANSFCSGTYG